MEDKSYAEVVKHMQSLGIVDQDYAEQLLKQDLPNASAAICITFTKHENRRVDYIFSIEKGALSDQCEVAGCMAKTIMIPEIVHGVFNGIDTRDLDNRLDCINWSKNVLPVPMGGDAISNIFADLILLNQSGEMAAHDIAEKLMVKHWANTVMERSFIISPEMSKYEKTLQFPIRMDMNDVDDTQIYHLLNGRSVIKFDIQEGLQTSAYWLKEEESKLILLKDFDLAGRLNELPFSEPTSDVRKLEMFYDLLSGDRISISMKLGNKVVPTLIQADPVHAKITVYDQDMKLMDVSMLKRQAEIKRIPKAIRPGPRKPRKGKGL